MSAENMLENSKRGKGAKSVKIMMIRMLVLVLELALEQIFNQVLFHPIINTLLIC